MGRNKIWFDSQGDRCAAWHYPGSNGACIVMAGGGGVTKEPGTDRFAQRFNADGFSVLAFDYRRLGESEGEPRQVIRIPDQLRDWNAAIAAARSLPEVASQRIGLWGFSLSGGHLFKIAARTPVAAVVAQTPTADGFAATPNALRHETLGVILRMPLLALADLTRGMLGRPPLTVPLTGVKGTVAMITTPDAQHGPAALDPDGNYPDWQQTIAARSVLPMGGYRPGRVARRVSAPLLVVVADDDQTSLAEPAIRAARQAPNATVLRVPGGHYAPFLNQHETVVRAELDFFHDHLLSQADGGGVARTHVQGALQPRAA